MHGPKDHAFHARRMLVAPPRGYRVRVGLLNRTSRLLIDVLDYGFALLYALLAARLVLLLIGGPMGSMLTRMLRPLSDRFILPFEAVLPPLLQEPLELLLPIVAAMIVSVAAHCLLRAALRYVSRNSRVKLVSSMEGMLRRLVARDDGRVRVVDAIREA